MDTFLEIIQGVQSDLTIGDTTSFSNLIAQKLAINSAYRKAGGLYPWSDLTDAKKAPTEAGQEYYDMPPTWRPDSVWRLEIDGVQYGEDPDGSPLDWSDYLVWRNDTTNATSTDKKWSVYKRKIFIFPVPTVTGSLDANTGVFTIYGQENVDTLSLDDDTTIFSYAMPECNEAIRLEAVAILENKGDDEQKSQFRSLEAKGILANAWARIKSAQGKYEKNLPFFDVPDLFGNSVQKIKDNIGNF